jgi:hypothetical protein
MSRIEFLENILAPNYLAELVNPDLRKADREFHEIVRQVENLNPLQLPLQLHLEVDGKVLEMKKRVDDKDIFLFHYDPIGEDNKHQPILIPFRPKALIEEKCFYLYLLPELNETGERIDLGIGIIKKVKRDYFTGWKDPHFEMAARKQKHNGNYIFLVQHVYLQEEDYLKAAWTQLDLDKEYGRMYVLG